MRQTRVVHYNHTGAVAGAERVLLQALPFLRQHGIVSTVLSPAGPLQYEAQQANVLREECFSLQARFTWNPVRLCEYLLSFGQSVAALRRQLRQLAPDVVHANSVRAGLVATLSMAFSGTPVVWHVHDTLPHHPLSVIIRLWTRLSARTSHVAVSASTARTFAGTLWKRALSAKTTVLHNAVSSRERSLSEADRAQLRRTLGAEGKLLIGCVGQICTRKNQLGLLEMFRTVLEHEPNTVLAFVGTALFAQNAPYERALRERIAELGLENKVLLLGTRRDVPALLEVFDVLALPSLHEPFGMILLEAAAAGLATVAFAVDGVPELLADRRTAWLVPPGDAAQMSRTLVWALRHPEQRARLGEAARADLRKWRDPGAYGAELARLLREASRAQIAGAAEGLGEPVPLEDAA